MIKNKIKVSVFALLLLCSVSSAFAFIPLIPGVAVLATYLGASAELATAIDFSLLLHASVLAIALNQSSGAATSPTSAPLTVKLNPKDPLPTPTGWTAAAAGTITPIPPSSGGAAVYTISGTYKLTTKTWNSGNSTYSYTYGTLQNFAVGQPTESAVCGVLYPNSSSSGNGNCWIGTPNGSGQSNYIVITFLSESSSNVCKAGYTLSGSNCNLTNAALVMKPSDGNCQIRRIANAYSVDNLDPDCATGSPQINPVNTTIMPSYVSIKNNANGSTSTTTINADGSVTSKECYPDLPNDKTNCITNKFSVPDATTGAVTFDGQSVSSDTGIGTGVDTPVAPAADYSKSGEAAAAASAVVAATTGSDAAVAAVPAAVAAVIGTPYTSGIQSTIMGWFPSSSNAASGSDGSAMADAAGAVPLPAAVTCVNPTATPLTGRPAITVNWCGMQAAFQPVINWGLNIIAALYAMGMLFAVSSASDKMNRSYN